MTTRRAVVLGVIGTAMVPACAARVPNPPKIGAIRWPGAAGDVHGYMAVPADAHGRQPAVLVVPDRSGADRFALGLVDALATAGFVTCIPKAFASTDDVVATLGWLARNRYATGRVAIVGLGWGCELAERARATAPIPVAATILLGGKALVQSDRAMLALDSFEALTARGADAYDAAWRRMIAFLKEALA